MARQLVGICGSAMTRIEVSRSEVADYSPMHFTSIRRT
jgi:hypothetical protein